MELFYHAPGIGEFFTIKFPGTIAVLPVVINHKYACRETVFKDILSIFEDVLFILIILKFYPGVVLWICEQERIGSLSGRREECFTAIQERILKSFPGFSRNNFSSHGLNSYFFRRERYFQWFFTPDVSAFV